MKIIPIKLKTANAFVTEHHRHHKKCAGCKFCIGLQNENSELIGVAIWVVLLADIMMME